MSKTRCIPEVEYYDEKAGECRLKPEVKELVEKPSGLSVSDSALEEDLGIEDWERWGFTGIDQSRDSDFLTQSNFETISKELEEEFPDDVKILRSGHWGVGWVEQLIVRVYNEKGYTEAFNKMKDIAKQLENYPVADEEDFSRREYEDTLENISTELHYASMNFKNADDVDPKEIFTWLWDNNQRAVEPMDGFGGYPSKKDIEEALEGLGYEREEE